MKKVLFPFVLMFALLFVACDSETNDNPNNGDSPTPLTKAAENIIEASNNFTFKIFDELEKEYSNENIFFSPLSMSMAFSMALNGANGETKQQIKNVIDFGSYSDEEINMAFKSLHDAFETLDEQVEISLANSAWYKENYELIENYRNILLDYYYAEIAGLNFSDPVSVDIINDWIANKTKDKIKDMISELDPSTVLVLVNAIYFNGTWTYEFDEDNTYDGSFKGLKNENIACKMMESGKLKTKFHVSEDLTLATLPYGDGNFEMVLYMSTDNSSIQTIINDMDAAKLAGLLSDATEDSIVVHMPKFKIETQTISIKDMLINLGMVLPFSDLADFSNIFGSGHDIFISDVLHKAFIEVNEEGTEAAAATVIIFDESSVGGGSEEIILYFNKPFLFFIREVSTSEILFAGKLINPVYNE